MSLIPLASQQTLQLTGSSHVSIRAVYKETGVWGLMTESLQSGPLGDVRESSEGTLVAFQHLFVFLLLQSLHVCPAIPTLSSEWELLVFWALQSFTQPPALLVWLSEDILPNQ